MAAGNYFQMLDSPSGGRVGELVAPVAPADVCSGDFTIHYIAGAASSSYPNGTLLTLCSSFSASAGLYYFGLYKVGAGDWRVRVNLGGGLVVERGSLSWADRAEMTFTFESRIKRVTVSGAATGNGSSTWTINWFWPGGNFRLGGMAGGGDLSSSALVCDGWVSLPYAVAGAAPASIVNLDFSRTTNSAHVHTVGH